MSDLVNTPARRSTTVALPFLPPEATIPSGGRAKKGSSDTGDAAARGDRADSAGKKKKRRLGDGRTATTSSAQSNGQNKRSASKKKKRKIDDGNVAPAPLPPNRTVCIAEATLTRCIQQSLSAGEGHPQDLDDLPKERINALPSTSYESTKRPAVVVNGAAAADAAVAAIRSELAAQGGERAFHYLGFDTETRPNFRKGGDNPPALIQLATSTTAYLFRLAVQGSRGSSALTAALRQLLADPRVVKVGVGIHKDVLDLQREHGARVGGDGATYLDLGPLVRARWPRIRRAGLRNLTATVLGRRLSKAQQMKNWEAATLTPAMQAYAAADAWVALDLLAAIVGRGHVF